jgi:hypothetical protein
MNVVKNPNLIVKGLTLAALILLVVSYFTPIWWVSLTAPNYPKEAFPDGIRIHFHFNGVFNGCKPVTTGQMAQETVQELGELGEDVVGGSATVGLDCVHEMNTINHYVGMYPIDTGAPVEVPLSKFFFGFFVVLLLGFMATQRKQQLMILGAGFTAVTAWMVTDQIVMGQLNAFSDHYYREASTFFNQPEILARWVANLKLATKAAMAGLVVAMLIIMLGVWKIRKFSLLLALVPALLPVFFVLDYAGWLWFFGHNMHPWGAFTVKPFMPTVFGEGKVAQFSTYSYPYYGYGLLLLTSASLLPAILIRRKMMREEQG